MAARRSLCAAGATLIALVALWPAGCKSPPLGSARIDIVPATLDGIAVKTSQRQVIALLGEPRLRDVAGGEREIWSWSYREELTPSGATLLRIDNGLDPTSARSVFVEFEKSRVTRVWRQ
jgi:hypothetical protein